MTVRSLKYFIITENLSEAAELVDEISAASTEESRGIAQVNTAVAEIDQVTQSNAANAEESASASEELSAQAAEHRELVKSLARIVGGKDVNVKGQFRGRGTLSQSATLRKLHCEKDTVSQKQGIKLLAPKENAAAFKEDKQVSPDEIIPLEEF